MDISYRLEKVASKVKSGTKIADVGTDHAYIPIYLSLQNVIQSAIAMDVKKGPLQIADRNIKKYDLVEKIETRLSDGLHELKPLEADTIIIAGMGGLLMNRILEEGSHILDSDVTLILQPQSEIPLVRQKIHELGYKIDDEDMLIDEDKIYNIIVATKGQESYDNSLFYQYGKHLIETKNEILITFLLKRRSTLERIFHSLEEKITTNSLLRIEEIKVELKTIEEVLRCL